MSKIVLSIVLTLFAGGAVVLGLNIISQDFSNPGNEQATLDFLRKDLAETNKNLEALSTRLNELESSQSQLSASLTNQKIDLSAITAPKKGDSTDSTNVVNSDLRNLVFSCIEENQKIKEAEQEKRREDLRKQMEDRRKQFEEFRKGPYEKFNMKVNSMAAALELDDTQKSNYYALLQKYETDFNESRKVLSEQKAQDKKEKGDQSNKDPENREDRQGSRRGRGGEDREAYKELAENIQKQFSEDFKAILTDTQVEGLEKLPSRSQSFYNSSMPATSTGSFGRSSFGNRGGSGMSRRGGGGRGR